MAGGIDGDGVDAGGADAAGAGGTPPGGSAPGADSGSGAWSCGGAESSHTESDADGVPVAVVRTIYDGEGRVVLESREPLGDRGVARFCYADPAPGDEAAGAEQPAEGRAPWEGVAGAMLWVGYDAEGRPAWRVEGGPDGPRGGLLTPDGPAGGAGAPCPACGGGGRAVLLTSAGPCERCGGTGRLAGGGPGAG